MSDPTDFPSDTFTDGPAASGGQPSGGSGSRYQPAASVNFEAGDHHVSANPAERLAASRAVRRSWARFPYYARRYGERGRRFSASDSGWLITLCDLDQRAADHQARWLGELLSARGMPQWLLECHLRMLEEELVAARPHGAAHYARLGQAAAAMREERARWMPDERLAELSASFDRRVGEPLNRQHREMGAILATAVADERNGIRTAVTSVTSWACDRTRFPERFVTAAELVVAEARAG